MSNYVKLLDIVSQITSGATPESGSARYYTEDDGIKFAKTEDLSASKSRYIEETDLKVKEIALRETSLKIYPKDTILVSMYGTIGLTKIVKEPLAANQALCALIPPFKCDIEYLYYYLTSLKSEWTRLSAQTTQANINGEIVKNKEIWLPELSKQKEIAKILTKIDGCIETSNSTLDKLQNIKAGLLNDLLTRGVDSQGNLRPGYEDAPDLYQETGLGFIPKEWEICGLHDIQRADKPVLKTGPFGSALKSEHWRESGHPVITIGSLGVNTIIESELLYIDDLTFNGLSTYLVEGGDIIFSRVADVGRCLIVQEHHKDWVMSSNLMRISVDKKIFKPELLTFILSSSSSLRKQIRKLVNSAGRDVANGEVLMKLKFAKPPVEEQVKIINIVERMNMAIDQELEQLNKLSNIKTGLLKDLLQN